MPRKLWNGNTIQVVWLRCPLWKGSKNMSERQTQVTRLVERPGFTAHAQTRRPRYLRPEVISYTEEDILAELGPAWANGTYNPGDIQWNGLGPTVP